MCLNRLQKLEADVMAILNDEAMHSRLSPRELQYAKVSGLLAQSHPASCAPWALPLACRLAVHCACPFISGYDVCHSF